MFQNDDSKNYTIFHMRYLQSAAKRIEKSHAKENTLRASYSEKKCTMCTTVMDVGST